MNKAFLIDIFLHRHNQSLLEDIKPIILAKISNSYVLPFLSASCSHYNSFHFNLFLRTMTNEPPTYEELVAPQQNDILPSYNQSLATQEPLQTYALTYTSPKTAILTPTLPSNISSPPSFNITLTYQQKAFRKRTPDIVISQAESGSLDETSPTIASVIFDPSSSNSSIIYQSPRGGSSRQETTLRLESALTRQYITQILGQTCYILPDISRNNEILLVEHKDALSTPWARFVPYCPPSNSNLDQNSSHASPLESNEHSFSRRLRSSSSSQDKKDFNETQEQIGDLKIYRRDLDNNMRDEIVCVLVAVVDRAKRMKAAVGKEKGSIVRNYAYGAAATNVA